ncbi:methyl-accepting chemotaxis protein [Colwellia sp. RSH04]|uniref:methyl-accepting chemotaxis protein n=1 Tax=Colwellia sp. RSH04 TaxID=2305464 RepID=UPI000E57F8FD|nr:methyl-accepting chemotaxis protein [Colwellia sp. RSH04]RHW77088.1 PAS domain-containing protein [Colwellia sp. RSH04]
MTPKQISLVQESWIKVLPIAPKAAEIFYQTLFEMDPALTSLFPEDLTEQGKKLMSMLDTAVKLLNDPNKLIPAVEKLGIKHLEYGTKEEHYATVGAALIKTLTVGLGDEFTPSVKRAWTAVYKTLSTTMITAANNSARENKQSNKSNKKGAMMNNKTKEGNDLAVRLQGALDQSMTAFMMIDRNFTITYFNKATLDLLKKHEETFVKKWPSFKADADSMMGINIDMFHKNPEHQRKLLSDPANLPFTTDIKILHLTIELNVTAIMDLNGEYIGNSLEWSDVTEIRSKSLEVGRLTSAVEGMTTNLMMADTQGNIVYANPAVLNMLRRREERLRTALPSFSVDKVIGTNFDSFHKNPAHQQNLLGNPDNLPYSAEINVVGLTFQLIAIPLRDDKGNHVGNAVQWLDLTEEKDAQKQIENLITDAISGKLDSRIDTENYEGFMNVLGTNINNLMDAIVEPINDAINIAQALADGDLTQSMNDNYGGEFLALANAMNGSIENLTNMVGEIRGASTNVFDSAREIAEGNNELSHRTESQASSLEETASAMEEITSTVQQNAENATEASKLSDSVMDKATNGGSVVRNAITAMSDINKSSKKIADIISVIDEIAFQTNLLALNAAVEAARAGEQGRGFAVVAAEVRNLAQRSAGAAKEIKGLINDSVEAVGQGTKLVDETGQTFSELVTSIEEVSKMISDIDSAGKEQSAGIREVSAAVSQMDEMTQQNAALVEEAAASSKSMEEQSQALLEQVAFLNTGEEEQKPVIRSPRQNSNKRTSKFSPAVPSLSSKAKRPVTPVDQEWEEF